MGLSGAVFADVNVAFFNESPKEQQIIERCFSVSSINYIQTENIRETIDMVSEGLADVGIGNITINKQRADLVNFSYPHTSVETRVLVKSSSGFIGFVKNNSKGIFYLCVFLFFFCSIIIWYTEQNSEAINEALKRTSLIKKSA